MEQPTIGGAIEILIVSIFTVWGVNIGDKIAEKAPKRSGILFSGLGRRKTTYAKVKLPIPDLILDISARKEVSNAVKASYLKDSSSYLRICLSKVTQRIKRRLITDWGIGDAEIEIDQDGYVTQLAVFAKESGLSTALPKGNVALPVECRIIPANLVAGDVVRIFLDNNQTIEEAEVLGVSPDQKTITIITPFSWIEKVREKKAELVIALPNAMERLKTISVKHRSGAVEEYQVEKI